MLHNVSLRKLTFLAAGPFIADMMAMLVVCAIIVHANHLNMTPLQIGCMGAAYSLAYAFTAHYAGRWVKPRFAMVVLMISLPVAAVFNTVASQVNSLALLLGASTLTGVAVGHYFTPFQIKMGKVKPFTTLAWTVGFYNICWATGYATGAFSGCFLRSLEDPTWLILAAWILAAVHTAIAMAAHYDPSPDTQEYHASVAFNSTATQRWSGWIAILVAMFLLNGAMYTLWPAMAKAGKLRDIQMAVGMLLLAIPIPLTNFIWPRARKLMLRPWLIACLLVGMGAGFLLLPITPWPFTVAPLMLVGVGAGGLFFHTVYYSNGDAQNPGHSIGMNELMVGMGGVIGPPILGALAGKGEPSALPYFCGAALAVLASVAIPLVWRARSIRS